MKENPITAKANLATCRRLLSSIINEKLVNCQVIENLPNESAYYVKILPVHVETESESESEVEIDEDKLVSPSREEEGLVRFYITNKLPKHFVKDLEGKKKQGTVTQVHFCDPEDIRTDLPIHIGEEQVTNPCLVFDQIMPYIPGATDKVCTQLRSELTSSIQVQEIAYQVAIESGRGSPSLKNSCIEWEKSIIEGHATHPMHRTRMGISLEESKKWSAECEGKLDVEFITMPRDQILVFGNYESVLKGWLPEYDEDPSRIVLPIHPGQYRNLVKLFPSIQKINFTQPALAQTSIRTVSPVGLPYSIKLALAVQTTSGMRTVSPHSVYNGNIITAISKALAPPTLFIVDEIAAAGSNDPESDVAKHLACIVRLDPEVEMPDQRHITCCSLVEKNLEGVTNVISAFGLDTVEKRLSFLDDYTRLFFSSFIPPLLNGLAFEAHGQNTILRTDENGTVLGFSIRDFGGVRVHPEAVEKSTGIKVVLREGSAIVAHVMNDAYTVFFHSGIQQHIHRLVRSLGLHYDASGWNVVRKNLMPLIEGTELITVWFKPTIDVKCLFSMRMEGLYRDYLFTEAPNVLVTGL